MHSFAQQQRRTSGEEVATPTRGLVMNWGWRYDLLVWVADVLLRGALRPARQRTLDLAQLQRGEAVLVVGCGTGTLDVLVKERVGAAGRVTGVDPRPRQIAHARRKAARHGTPIDVQVGMIEHLPFPDQSFDVVLSTLLCMSL